MSPPSAVGFPPEREERVEVVLSADQGVPGRPFASIDRYERDSSILTSMVEDLRALFASAAAGTIDLVPHRKVTWRVHGLRRRVIVCDPGLLGAADELFAVGFMAEREPGLPVTALERANTKIVKEFVDYPGILSYSSWELAGRQWANLVLAEDDLVAERWRESEAHRRAVAELSPRHYRNVVIHHGRLPGGLGGGRWIVIDRTRYIDFEGDETWRAVRELRPSVA